MAERRKRECLPEVFATVNWLESRPIKTIIFRDESCCLGKEGNESNAMLGIFRLFLCFFSSKFGEFRDEAECGIYFSTFRVELRTSCFSREGRYKLRSLRLGEDWRETKEHELNVIDASFENWSIRFVGHSIYSVYLADRALSFSLSLSLSSLSPPPIAKSNDNLRRFGRSREWNKNRWSTTSATEQTKVQTQKARLRAGLFDRGQNSPGFNFPLAVNRIVPRPECSC